MIKTNTTWYECPVNNTGHGRAAELKAHYPVKKTAPCFNWKK